MAEHRKLHVHNSPGLPEIRIGEKAFMCVGALPPMDHPHVFIDMGSDSSAVCPYCSTLYVYDGALQGGVSPTECVYHPEPLGAGL